MNDYRNDPPEQPEPSECCDEIMDVDAKGACVCSKCGKRIEPQPDIEPPKDKPWTDDDERMVNMGEKCPHGSEWFSCDACDHASDLAYDAAREKRVR